MWAPWRLKLFFTLVPFVSLTMPSTELEIKIKFLSFLIKSSGAYHNRRYLVAAQHGLGIPRIPRVGTRKRWCHWVSSWSRGFPVFFSFYSSLTSTCNSLVEDRDLEQDLKCQKKITCTGRWDQMVTVAKEALESPYSWPQDKADIVLFSLLNLIPSLLVLCRLLLTGNGNRMGAFVFSQEL